MAATACSATVLAAVVVRTEQLWSLVPPPVIGFAVAALKPSTQEEAANAEFLAVWLTCVSIVGCAVALVLWLRRAVPRRWKHRAA